MAVRLTVIFFIVLCLEAGVALTLLPWISPTGISDWGDNYLLVYVSSQINLPILRSAIASGWVRGAVTALGVLNLIFAFWEIANFRRTVQSLEASHQMNSQTARKSKDVNGR